MPFDAPFWEGIVTGQAESPATVRARTPVTTVKFIYREQLIQVIEGENSRKGELSVITRDKDVPAHEVEKTVRRLADTRTD